MKDKQTTDSSSTTQLFLKPSFALLVILIIAASFLRFYALGEPELWADEMDYFGSSEDTIGKLKQKWVIDENRHETPDPPVMTIACRLALLGKEKELEHDAMGYIRTQEGRTRYRIPVAIAGVLSVLLMYWLGKILLNTRAALIAATLLTFMFYPIYYSREARPYSFVVLFSIAVMLTFLRMVKKPDLARCALFALSLTLSFYTHYFCAFLGIVATIWTGVYFLIQRAANPLQGKKFLLRSILALAASAALYLPWLPAYFRAVDQGMRGLPAGQPLALGADFSFFIDLMTRWTVGPQSPYAMFALALLGAVWLGRKRIDAAILLLSTLLIPWLILPWIPGSLYTFYRYMIFQLPAFLLLLTAGIDATYQFFKSSPKLPMSARRPLAYFAMAVMILFLLLPSLRLLPTKAKCVGENSEWSIECCKFIDRCETKPPKE